MDLTPPPPLSKSGLKLVCNVNIVYGNLKSENSKDYAQKPQRNSTFMSSRLLSNSSIIILSCMYGTVRMGTHRSKGLFHQEDKKSRKNVRHVTHASIPISATSLLAKHK
jgi:hypothetical protein